MADKEEFSFMEEKIMESKKPKRRFVAEAKRMVLLGIIFGSVAGACFACVNGMISRNGGTATSKEIETKTSSVLGVSFLLYILPVFILIISALMCDSLNLGYYSILVFGVLLSLWYGAIKTLNKKIKIQNTITQIIP